MTARPGALSGHVERVMNMPVSFAVADPLPISVVQPACEWLHWVEATFSTFRPSSEISRIATGELDPIDAHPLVLEVLDICDDLFVRSDGIFDPYARGLLDPAGVVKGWAVERAARIMEEQGARNFTINAGGDIAIRGQAADGDPWTTGVVNPLRTHEVVKVVAHTETPAAIATSGAYERGQHVVDTRTDGPVHACLSATVTGTDLTYADAYATVVFVMGVDGLGWLMEQPGGYQGYVILDGERATSTPDFGR
jgi:FAD:protein FMN transferase